jgi:hypothetical protein
MIFHVVALDDWLAFSDRSYALSSFAEKGLVQAHQSLQWRLRGPQALSVVPRRGRGD